MNEKDVLMWRGCQTFAFQQFHYGIKSDAGKPWLPFLPQISKFICAWDCNNKMATMSLAAYLQSVLKKH